MASLKEVKNRITSVRTTRKITQARQMVSSAQLHRAQAALTASHAYLIALKEVTAQVAYTLPDSLPICTERAAGPVAVVVMAANGGMCGSFNARIIREMHRMAEEIGRSEVVFFPVGKKVRDAALASGYTVEGDFDALADKASAEEIAAMASMLVRRFLARDFRQVEMLHYNFRSVALQRIAQERMLPLTLVEEVDSVPTDYIVEPSAEALAAQLLPMLVDAKLQAWVASSRASEHAARMLAMQLATENADELLDELQLSYNKLRQQNITSELLDIIGSSFA